MMLELAQVLPMDTPMGKADAHFVIDYGSESHLLWVCFMRETGECRTFQNPDVRLERNWTMGTRAADGNDTRQRGL